MTTDAPACDAPDELTPEWLTAALRGAGFSGTVVSASLERVGTGQMGTSYRVDLTWADPDAAAEEEAPSSVVAKMAAGDAASRAVTSGGYRCEVGFYRELVGTVAVSAPRCLHAAMSDDAHRFTLLLEDLAPARPGDQVTGLTPQEAELAVVNLAGLHGPRWNDAALLEVPWLSHHTPETAGFYADVLAGAIPTFVERFGSRLSPEDVATLDEVPRHLAAWLTARPDRLSVIHGDYRPDNLMFSPGGSRVVALDWQTVALGLPGRDVGYLLATSLDPAVRRAEERRLVEAYRQALAGHGIDLSAEDCFDDHRLGVVQGPLITVLGAVYANDPSPSSDNMFTAMITRSLAAIRDLDPWSLL